MTPDLDAFRAEVRAFLDAELTDEMREAAVKSTSVFTPFAPCMAWQQALAAKGWAAKPVLSKGHEEYFTLNGVTDKDVVNSSPDAVVKAEKVKLEGSGKFGTVGV